MLAGSGSEKKREFPTNSGRPGLLLRRLRADTPVVTRSAAETLHFGPFEFDPRTSELRREGQLVPLAPQPARLLEALASRAGELVTREELQKIIWGSETFVDYERGLNFCVLQVRAVLEDDARNPRYIETLPKRGYRFIGALRPVERQSRPRYLAFAAAALLPVLMVAAWDRRAVPVSQTVLTATVPAAHDAYLRGRNLWNRRNAADVEASAEAFRTAMRLDSSFVLPRIALAESLHSLVMAGRMRPADAAVQIRPAVKEAVAMAPDLPQAHAVAAMLSFWYDWDRAAAEKSYRRAIALNPNDAGAIHDRGWMLISRGRFDEGLAEVRRAQELDPLSPRANTHVAWAYIFARRYELAVREAKRALELDPHFKEAYVCMQRAYELMGDFDAAFAVRERRLILEGRPLETPGDRRDFLMAVRQRTAADLEASGTDPYTTAAALAFAGQPDRAMSWLRKARAERSTAFLMMAVDPMLDSLRGREDFASLLRSVDRR